MLPSTDSVTSQQSYQLSMENAESLKTAVGQTSKGQDVVLAETASPQLTPPDLKAGYSPSFETKPTIGQRLACPFKTAGNYSVRAGVGAGMATEVIGVSAGAMAGVVGGAVLTMPLAGATKLLELITRSKRGIAGKMLKAGACLGACFGGTVTGLITAPVASIVGAVSGLVGGGVGFIRGTIDGIKGNVNRRAMLKPVFEYSFTSIREGAFQKKKPSAEQSGPQQKPEIRFDAPDLPEEEESSTDKFEAWASKQDEDSPEHTALTVGLQNSSSTD